MNKVNRTAVSILAICCFAGCADRREPAWGLGLRWLGDDGAMDAQWMGLRFIRLDRYDLYGADSYQFSGTHCIRHHLVGTYYVGIRQFGWKHASNPVLPKLQEKRSDRLAQLPLLWSRYFQRVICEGGSEGLAL